MQRGGQINRMLTCLRLPACGKYKLFSMMDEIRCRKLCELGSAGKRRLNSLGAA